MRIISNHDINEEILTVLGEILEDYEIIVSRTIGHESEKEILKGETPNKCRFCSKSSPEVSFQTEAHAIPMFIGNKKLLSAYECDSCNKDYFNKFETEFANFMLPYNALSGTLNRKNKTQKYKLEGEPTIKFEPDMINITGIDNSTFNNFDGTTMEVSFKTPTYIPEYIYRCLVKIGLTILDEEKLINYRQTIDWLMNLDKLSNIKPMLLFSHYPYSHQVNEIKCVILERKENCEKNIPFSILFLSYRNFAFQTYLPHCIKEKFNVELNAFPFIFPMTFDLNKQHENLKAIELLDLSSNIQDRTRQIKYTISGEGAQRIDI
jgi:hypothetical protein